MILRLAYLESFLIYLCASRMEFGFEIMRSFLGSATTPTIRRRNSSSRHQSPQKKVSSFIWRNKSTSHEARHEILEQSLWHGLFLRVLSVLACAGRGLCFFEYSEKRCYIPFFCPHASFAGMAERTLCFFCSSCFVFFFLVISVLTAMASRQWCSLLRNGSGVRGTG